VNAGVATKSTIAVELFVNNLFDRNAQLYRYAEVHDLFGRYADLRRQPAPP
jgi:hypothetical protein